MTKQETYEKTIEMAGGNNIVVELPVRGCFFKLDELEINELPKLYGFEFTVAGNENIYFDYQRTKRSEVRKGFCKVV